ncbi:hypothetical protein H0H81_000390 [Sphagnurus paluster]|uniref:Protein transport protein sec16 n=1 Tax=Sphagnurus paluster TaxID=117069 RepID=A0A9P7FU42_9AGAR|nr:hypothetical protein H0H81_000390 [Sphagnurus paluster]
MNGVEAAASLFGSEELGSDPFASLGGVPPQSSENDLFSGDGASTNSGFLDGPQPSDLFPLEDISAQDAYQYNTQTYNGYSTNSTYSDMAAGTTSQTGWYSSQGSSQNYPQPPQSTEAKLNTTAESYAPQHEYQSTNNAYAAYVPSVNAYAPTPAFENPVQNQSTYNPYLPSQVSSSYAPPQPAALVNSSYSPNAYAPTVTQALGSQNTPVFGGARTPYAVPVQQTTPHQPSSLVPVPAPTPTSTVTRPKISNAYDPPFPTVAKGKRGTRSGSGPQSYGYSAYEAISPPVKAYTSQALQYSTSQTPPPQGTPSQQIPPTQLPNRNHPTYRPPSRPNSSHDLLEQNPSGIHPTNLNTHINREGDNFTTEGSTDNYVAETQPYRVHRIQQSAGEETAPLSDIVQTSLNSSSPQVFDVSHVDCFSEPLNGHSPYAASTRSAEEERIQLSSTSGSDVSASISLVTSFRVDSPHRQPLPPSPTSSQHRRASPFSETHILSKKSTASPRPFVEYPRQAVLEVELPTATRETVHTSNIRSPQQTYNSPLRTSSPATSIINGSHSPPTAVAHSYLHKSSAGGDRAASPVRLLNGQIDTIPDPYAPPKAQATGYPTETTVSPSTVPRTVNPAPPTPKNYSAYSYIPSENTERCRSMSNSSMLSSASTSLEDPYAPSQRPKPMPSETEYGISSTRSNYTDGQNVNPQLAVHSDYLGQDVLVKTFQTAYAPSPSLMGANDPLGRTSTRVPIFSFGFGGKFVTCFHGANQLNTGFDVALSSRNSTGIHIRVLNKLIPESALDTSTSVFPGPLFGDSLTTSLVRTGTTAQTKTKKAKVTKYLSERTDELSLGLRYLKPGSLESLRAEAKLILIKLLKLMVEHDGHLTGTSDLDIAVRLALVPRLEGTFGSHGFSAIADTQASPLPGFSGESHEAPISVTNLRSSTLDKIQDFLLRGERRQAYHYALDEKLWAHAMVISSSIDKEAWKEVVSEFLRTELGSNTGQSIGDSFLPVNGRQSLRTAYSLFSGQGAALGNTHVSQQVDSMKLISFAVQELMPQNLLGRTNGHLQPPRASRLTPRTPSFAGGAPVPASGIPPEALGNWAETVAMMLSNPLSQETSAAISALGDNLAASQMFEAAHICYILAPQTSPWGGIGHPSARFILVGSRNPQTWPNFAKDQDPLIFSEILEFALSLGAPVKGQDVFTGISHLQAYRFIRAVALADIGDIQQANRYCDAIAASVQRNSPYATPALLEQLKGLSDRIAGVTQVDKSFWTGAKLSKPSLDTIGGWLEGRFTKLVTGDVDTDKVPEEEVIKPDDSGFSGPFSHYSTISSATPSARSSPVPSMVNLNVLPPARTGSAMAVAPTYTYPHIDRASSAMDYVTRRPSPGPRIASANASTTSFASAPSFGQALNSQHSYNGYSPSEDLVTPRPSAAADDESTGQEAHWWGGTTYAEDTPTAATFLRVDGNTVPADASSNGFISLMDSPSYTVGPPAPLSASTQSSTQYEGEDEDLGFGNSKHKLDKGENRQATTSPSPEPIKPTTQPESEATPAPAGGGWLSRWWKKSDAPAGPVKASLGEESAFYYDKELKRWVNKKAGGADAPKPATPPPPPSRAQTASPGMSGSRPPLASEAVPNRSASAIDLSTSPPSRTVMRVRSNLVPAPDSAPSTPTGTRLAPSGPPPGRPKSQASKRNIRSRYVDVFQQETSA